MRIKSSNQRVFSQDTFPSVSRVQLAIVAISFVLIGCGGGSTPESVATDKGSEGPASHTLKLTSEERAQLDRDIDFILSGPAPTPQEKFDAFVDQMDLVIDQAARRDLSIDTSSKILLGLHEIVEGDLAKRFDQETGDLLVRAGDDRLRNEDFQRLGQKLKLFRANLQEAVGDRLKQGLRRKEELERDLVKEGALVPKNPQE